MHLSWQSPAIRGLQSDCRYVRNNEQVTFIICLCPSCDIVQSSCDIAQLPPRNTVYTSEASAILVEVGGGYETIADVPYLRWHDNPRAFCQGSPSNTSLVEVSVEHGCWGEGEGCLNQFKMAETRPF